MFSIEMIAETKAWQIEMMPHRGTPIAELLDLRDYEDEPLYMAVLRSVACEIVRREMPKAQGKRFLRMFMREPINADTLELFGHILNAIEFVDAQDKGEI